MPVKPGTVFLNYQPESLINVSFKELGNVTILKVCAQLNTGFYSLIGKTTKGLKIGNESG
jgi:hypothetical protein